MDEKDDFESHNSMVWSTLFYDEFLVSTVFYYKQSPNSNWNIDFKFLQNKTR